MGFPCWPAFLRRLGERPWIRFAAGLILIGALFLGFALALRFVFVILNWSALRRSGLGLVAWGFLVGIRFDTAMICLLLLPAMALYTCAGVLARLWMRRLAIGYLCGAVLFIGLISLADLQYFEESGKHFTYEALAYFNPFVFTILGEAALASPWMTGLSVLGCAGLGLLSAFVFGRILGRCLPPANGQKRPALLAMLPIAMAIAIVGARGGFQSRPINIGNSCICADPMVNAVCLNPVYSVLRTLTQPRGQIVKFYNEKSNVETVRRMLGLDPLPADPKYPLMRVSKGISGGNRRNIVLFILESWTGKSIGCLRGPVGITPEFDRLAADGMLFENFYATGLRTTEGLFTLLASFPNQPVIPMMNRPVIYQTRWRSLSQILGEAGYTNLFIHGRDLKFDEMDRLLRALHFDVLIDRVNLGNGEPPDIGPWKGYHDGEVMRKADELFAAQKGPFFGVIYTMNTHPPFIIPKEFKLPFKARTPYEKYLASLYYTDHAIGEFIRQARGHDYFKNTIFMFVSDHARMIEGELNSRDQVRIPFLIYAPGMVNPGLCEDEASQLDVLPTALALLQLKAGHASWGRDLMGPDSRATHAEAAVGSEVRLFSSHHLIVDTLTNRTPMLFDLTLDPACRTDEWAKHSGFGKELEREVRASISLSQGLLYANRICP